MFKIAVLVWLMLGVTFAGAALTVVLAVPSLSGDAMKLLPIASGIGFLVAIPASIWVAKKILAVTKGV